MSFKEDIERKVREFKATQKEKSEFKKKLDMKKWKAVEIAKAKQEVRDARTGKKKKDLLDDFEFDINRVSVYDKEVNLK